jgi:thiamine kinase-like enzyme
MSNSTQEYRLIKLTHKQIRNLQRFDLPLVFEHGDFGPPNIVRCYDGTIGVVDWELAEPKGFPALDLFFLLALVGFARQRSRKNSDYLAAFQNTFFGKNPWAKPYINTYREKLNISQEILQALFLLCWSRCVINSAQRLHELDSSGGVLSDKTALWLRSNRYYVLWQYAVEHFAQLNLVD